MFLRSIDLRFRVGMPQFWSVLPLSVGTHMVREWYESGTNVSGAELGRRAAILSLLTLLHLRRVSLPAACVHFLVLLLLLYSFSPPSSSSFHVICFFFFFFGFFFFSSVLIQILGPPSPNFCRAAPFVRQCNVLETTDSQHREIVPRVC